MTLIVAIKEPNGKVWVAGDGRSSTGEVRLDEKVFFLDSDKEKQYIIGIAGSYRYGQILKHYLKLPLPPVRKKKVDDFKHIAKIVEKVMAVLHKHHFAVEDDNVRLPRQDKDAEDHMEGHMLIAWKHHLYTIYVDYQYGCKARFYDAIGCGEDFALGSLHTTEREHMRMPEPLSRIEAALLAATDHDPYIGQPFNWKATDGRSGVFQIYREDEALC